MAYYIHAFSNLITKWFPAINLLNKWLEKLYQTVSNSLILCNLYTQKHWDVRDLC